MSSDPKSKVFRLKYNHCRKRVKQWEVDFKENNGRDPDKIDIKAAEPKIKEYYKIYWRLKSILLEKEILGSSDENVENEPCRLVEDSKKESRNFTLSLETQTTSRPKDVPSVEATQSRSRKQENPSKWSRSLSSKLFAGSSFHTRNPRKSLSKKSDLSSSTLDGTLSASFVSEISFQSLPSPDKDSPPSESSFLAENEVSPKIKSLIESKTALSPLFSSVKKFRICSPPHATTTQPVNPLSDLTVLSKQTLRDVDLKWLDRCTQAVEKEEEQGSSIADSGIGSAETSPTIFTPQDNKEDILSSDNEMIFASDDESNNLMTLSYKRKAAELESSTPKILEPTNAFSEISKKVKFEVEAKTIYNIVKPTATTSTATASRSLQTKKEALEHKIQSGTLNENYVKINMKKKVYVRGKRNFKLGNYKKQEWKRKKKNLDLHAGAESGGVLKCFKCGDIGHYARSCQAMKEDKLIPVDEAAEDDPGLPSLAEAEEMAREAGLNLPVRKKATLLVPEPSPLEDDLPHLDGVPQQVRITNVLPIEVTHETLLGVLGQFGHSAFRGGQEEAVQRILSGKSTLLMLSTGGGKSLCYQLPAYLYHQASPCIALVVSPLVSLMDDQVSGSLSFCKMGCLHTNQTEKQRAKVMEELKAGLLSALLVSPEAVVSCDNLGFGAIVKDLPPVAFACIDEVHCLSQWSYNFRPSYLMLTKVLSERFGVKTFLGLTATASKTTVASIVKELGITDAGGVIQDIPLPHHLHLSISRVRRKDAALLDLIKSSDGGATLVYCTRRDECVRLATLIRTALPGVTAQPYHAGLVASRRKTVQKNFMKGKLQVVVATVAFGMGINKQDIRCVFHYNMPKDWESYVQEVGRAGRDGHQARCNLLLDPKGSDLQELRRHIHSNAVDRPVLRRLLARVFSPCNCTPGACPGHEVAFSLGEAVNALDLPEENIATLLCYLELHPARLIQVLTPAYMTCRVQSYHAALGIRKAARQCPPLAVAAAQDEDAAKAGALTFDVIALSRQIGWDSGTVKRHLKQTEWAKDKSGAWKRSGMHVAFSILGQRVRSRGDLSPEQLDEALDYLVKRVEDQQSTALTLLQSVYSTFYYFSSEADGGEDCKSRSEEIKEAIRSYFSTEKLPGDIPILAIQDEDFNEEIVIADVRNLVCTYKDNTFNGRAVARIFHGMQSPNYPASMWFRSRQWRAHLDKPFGKLQQIATREILKLK